jgi:hypothetical protein
LSGALRGRASRDFSGRCPSARSSATGDSVFTPGNSGSFGALGNSCRRYQRYWRCRLNWSNLSEEIRRICRRRQTHRRYRTRVLQEGGCTKAPWAVHRRGAAKCVSRAGS